MAQSSPAGILRLADLFVLAVAIPVFILGDFPMLGLAVAGGVWLAQRLLQLAARRHIRRSIGAATTTRNRVMGIIAATMLARVWTVALAILIVGLTDRDAGLAAALLSAALVTVYLAGEAISRLFDADQPVAAPGVGSSNAVVEPGGSEEGGGLT